MDSAIVHGRDVQCERVPVLANASQQKAKLHSANSNQQKVSQTKRITSSIGTASKWLGCEPTIDATTNASDICTTNAFTLGCMCVCE